MDLIEALFCSDCAIVIANGDPSGIPDDRVDAHLAAMDRELNGYHAIVGDDADLGFARRTCTGCGEDIATDQWFAGWLDPIRAGKE